MRAWSFYTHSGKNAYAGHSGYDDIAGRQYSYDSQVPNHRNVSVGDLIVVRGADSSLGIAFISRIDETEGMKKHNRCPQCGTSQLEKRTTLEPEFRCTNGHVFIDPIPTEDRVTRYRADLAGRYVDFDGLSRDDLERLCLLRSRQNAIRELDLDGTIDLLGRRGLLLTFIRA